MQAEVLAIGDEITSGQQLDTNSQWLSQRLEDLGVRVLYHTTVGDELEPGIEVFRQAIARADVVIATGGLGPTADDLTRPALAAATGVPLELKPEALDHIRRLFARRNRPMPPQNECQAYFPVGSQMVDNPEGTAPGISMQIARPGNRPCLFVALPGVPAEMRQMWDGSVVELLRQAGAGKTVVRHQLVRCFGAGESQIEAMLPDLIRRGRTPRVGITASQATITLRITAEADSEEACEAQIAPTLATIHQCLGERFVFGYDDEQLQDVVIRTLHEYATTLAVVECGTRGLVGLWLSEAEARQKVHPLCGALTLGEPARAARIVQCESLVGLACESVEFAEALAEAGRRWFEVDACLAVGPAPQYDRHAECPNEIHFGLAFADGSRHWSSPFATHSALLTTLAAKQALNFVRLTLVERNRQQAR